MPIKTKYTVVGENNDVIITLDNKTDAIDYAFEYFRSVDDDRNLNQVSVIDIDGNIIFTSFRTPMTYYFSGPMT